VVPSFLQKTAINFGGFENSNDTAISYFPILKREQ
jgi:hypothetical protein